MQAVTVVAHVFPGMHVPILQLLWEFLLVARHLTTCPDDDNCLQAFQLNVLPGTY